MIVFFNIDVEKSCVPWQNDKDVKACPTCQKKFTLTFRKHHCRLCGQIFCQFCFDYLDPALASEFLNLKNNLNFNLKLNNINFNFN